jgi:hypothetical protein
MVNSIENCMLKKCYCFFHFPICFGQVLELRNSQFNLENVINVPVSQRKTIWPTK